MIEYKDEYDAQGRLIAHTWSDDPKDPRSCRDEYDAQGRWIARTWGNDPNTPNRGGGRSGEMNNNSERHDPLAEALANLMHDIVEADVQTTEEIILEAFARVKRELKERAVGPNIDD